MVKIFSGRGGFTLIELLVVISIISLLSSVVLASLNSARNKSKIAATKQQMTQIVKGMVVAQGESSKTLTKITGTGWTAGSCIGAGKTPQDAGCYTAVFNAFTKIEVATNGLYSGLSSMVRDPWGNPYILDENQGEGNNQANCANVDLLKSAGPDGANGGGDDISSITIPFAPMCP